MGSNDHENGKHETDALSCFVRELEGVSHGGADGWAMNEVMGFELQRTSMLRDIDCTPNKAATFFSGQLLMCPSSRGNIAGGWTKVLWVVGVLLAWSPFNRYLFFFTAVHLPSDL